MSSLLPIPSRAASVASRWRVSAALALISWAALVPASEQESFDPDPGPNVIVIHVDDLGWADLGCQGSTFFETPNIDGLAADGVRFTQAYAACAVCSPSRAALQTGKWPARLGITDWIRATFQRGDSTDIQDPSPSYVGGPARPLLCPPNPYFLPLDEVTIGERMQAAGYRTCHIGKWHLGDEDWYPEHQGYDENFGGCDYGQPPSYFDPFTNKDLVQGIPGLEPRTEGQYLTDREADEAVAFIERNKDRQFFLHYAPYAVHTPIQAIEEVAERYRQKPNDSPQKNAKYAAMVQSVDDAVGRILAELARLELSDDTLIVFTSDNGGLVGPTRNLGLRSGKGFPYEGGLRVPMIVRWSGTIEGGRVVDEPVCGIDVTPTVCDLLGLDAPVGIDGRSFGPILQGAADLPERPLFFHFPHYRFGEVVPYSIVRSGRWKLIKHYEDRFFREGGPRFELFDLLSDPEEKADVSAANEGVVTRLDESLVEHLESVGARMPRTNPAFEALPKVLILGDSISIYYTRIVRKMLQGEARVYRPMQAWNRAENCEGTTKGVASIDRWLSAQGSDWDVIYFNFGLHDLKSVDPDTGRNSRNPNHPRQAEPETYRQNLEKIVERLEQTGARLIFATTTPVPENVNGPLRTPEDAILYNEIATSIMAEHEVEVLDLYGFALPQLDGLQKRRDVHFNPDGQQAFGEEVAGFLRARLR
ncbi:MAG: sulfatase-like hydrolase/transferase [Planctomycetota bacterium]